ncbi:hypothetical protein [Deinococcus sp. 6GRE01]|uniref:hypothetical protein n=1 Tax=Deinococcus sp. 6GRE01 TaxID=2745873 RepID=UPI001E61B033|nr:hypothetical protein [Deinococcus sp. 6GRE01]MCD0158245.1 hypothetical protein [Deinococcus sp. 6GRE01]
MTYSYAVKGRTYQSDRIGWDVFDESRHKGPDCASLGDDPQPAVGETIHTDSD